MLIKISLFVHVCTSFTQTREGASNIWGKIDGSSAEIQRLADRISRTGSNRLAGLFEMHYHRAVQPTKVHNDDAALSREGRKVSIISHVSFYPTSTVS